MSVMSGNLYRALKEAKVPEELAQKAAEEAAGHDTRFNRIEGELTMIRADLVLLKWMGGIITTSVAALVVKTFF